MGKMDPKTNQFNRRTFLQKAGLSGLIVPMAGWSFFEKQSRFDPFLSKDQSALKALPKQTKTRKICVFSKALQWTSIEQMAEMVAEAGFDGIDLTVRPGGHVEPDRVTDDLPMIDEAMKKAGKEIVMITTAIDNADEPVSETILNTAGKLGIQYYRMNWYKYDHSKSIDDNLKIYWQWMKGLSVLNQSNNIKAGYQNHAGLGVGAPVWDLAMLLRAVDSPWVGNQYDIRHATVEGANSWPLGFEYISPHINTLVIKDFLWSKDGLEWKEKNVPLGQGMVDFETYFEKVKTLSGDIPITVHMEYDLGGAESGSRQVNITREVMTKAMKGDRDFLRKFVG